jgi:hypothetical protein
MRRTSGCDAGGAWGFTVVSPQWDEKDVAQKALRAIVSDPAYGVAALSSAQTMANLLKDLLPDAPREVSILVAAAEAGVASSLRDRVSQGMDVGTASAVVAGSFAASTPFRPDACNWAVSEIARALGLSSPAPSPSPGSSIPPGSSVPASAQPTISAPVVAADQGPAAGGYPPAGGAGTYPAAAAGLGAYPAGAVPGAYPPGAAPGGYPPAAAPGGYPPAAAPGSYPPAAAPGSYPQAAAPGGYPPAAAPGSYPQAAAPGGYPPAAAPGSYPPAAAPGGYPPAAAPGSYPQAAAPGAYSPAGQAWPPDPYPSAPSRPGSAQGGYQAAGGYQSPPVPGYWSQPPAPGFVPTSRTNGLAIASLVLGVLWLFWLGSVVGLVLGLVALKQIRARNQGGRGIAIAGVVLSILWLLGLVAVIIVGASTGSSGS